MSASLHSLPSELLIKIFKYLNIYDLCNLKLTCVRFKDFVNSCLHLIVKNNFIATNQVHNIIKTRTLCELPIIEKFRISNNWKNGRYKEVVLLKEQKKCGPWLLLDENFLWLGSGNTITAYERHKNRIRTQNPRYKIVNSRQGDFSRFSYNNSYIIVGDCDGTVIIWSALKNQIIFEQPASHLSYIHAVDSKNSIYVTGSRDKYVKIWPLKDDDDYQNFTYLHAINIDDRVWTVSLSENAEYLFVGSAGRVAPPAQIIDLNRYDVKCKLDASPRGVSDAKWENSNIVWSCGYDAYLRRWDLRTGQCEQSWEDPFHATSYCFDIDYFCTALTGTINHGRVVLWDTRQSKYVQMYFMEVCKRGRSSPVYSLSFDAVHLYAGTDRNLTVLDFSVRGGETYDYSNLFYKDISV